MSDRDFSANLAPLRKVLPAVGSWQAALWAVGFLSLGALARAPFDAAVNARLPPFLTIYPAVVMASFVGGLRIGAAAAVIGGVLSWALWLAPTGYDLPRYALINLAVYTIAVGVTVGAAGLARHLLDSCIVLERERAQQARETVHRIKNLIAVVQALSRKTMGETMDQAQFIDRMDRRLGALGRAQDVLVQSEWGDTDLKTLVDTALEPFLSDSRLRVLGGPAIVTPAKLVSGLSMALYELATNALKYGALDAENGSVELSWRRNAGRCLVEWRETGGAKADDMEGFGSSLIRSAMGADRSGRVSYARTAAGLACLFDWPESARG